MKNLTITAILVLMFLGFNACKKEVTTDIVTYELTLKALISPNPFGNGSTVFDEIKYNDSSQVVKTLTNVKSDFTVSFAVKPNFPILLSTKATIIGSGIPRLLPFPPRTIYQILKITNGIKRDTICQGFEASFGSNDTIFKSVASFSKIFAETNCK
jgi:hypothetical protein